jgi:hypothetical protein
MSRITVETNDLVRALDHFLEASRRVSKRRILKPIERTLELAMKKAFRAQGKAFLKLFGQVKPVWAVVEAAEAERMLLSEGIGDEVIEPLFDKAALETLGVFTVPLQRAEQKALASGAKGLLAELGLAVSFSLRNPRATAYLEDHGAALVKQINETTMGHLREMVTYAVDNGWSYQKTALAIQKRFTGYYDPGSWWNFDAPRAQAHIASRAHLIAVTESGNAYEAGNYIVTQDLESAGIETEKKWVTMGDSRVSEGCLENEAEEWIPSQQNHLSGHPHPLRFPGCLPGWQGVVADHVLGATKRFFDGELIVIRTATGNELTCTPNHPILTPEGWIGAGLLDIGSDVICAPLTYRPQGTAHVNDQYRPALIEKVAAAFGSSSDVRSKVVKVASPDFHGDGKGSQVAIVWTNGLLRNHVGPPGREHGKQKNFIGTNIGRVCFSGLRHLGAFFNRVFSTARRNMSGFGISSVFFWGAIGHHQTVRVGWSAQRNTKFDQPFSNEIAAHPKRFSEFNGGFTSQVPGNDLAHWQRDVERIRSLCATSIDTVLEVRRIVFRGHVYNLQTEQGFYIAGGIVTHNCRCDEFYRVKSQEAG